MEFNGLKRKKLAPLTYPQSISERVYYLIIVLIASHDLRYFIQIWDVLSRREKLFVAKSKAFRTIVHLLQPSPGKTFIENLLSLYPPSPLPAPSTSNSLVKARKLPDWLKKYVPRISSHPLKFIPLFEDCNSLKLSDDEHSVILEILMVNTFIIGDFEGFLHCWDLLSVKQKIDLAKSKSFRHYVEPLFPSPGKTFIENLLSLYASFPDPSPPTTRAASSPVASPPTTSTALAVLAHAASPPTTRAASPPTTRAASRRKRTRTSTPPTTRASSRRKTTVDLTQSATSS